MKGVACERGGDFPFMVVLVDVFVHVLVVQETVYPVNAGVCEKYEGKHWHPDYGVSWNKIKIYGIEIKYYNYYLKKYQNGYRSPSSEKS